MVPLSIDKRSVLIFVLILLLALSIRAVFLLRGPFNTDASMAAVLTMRQAIANNYTIGPDPLAHFPQHHYSFVEKGIVYLAILPYRMLPFLGLFGTMYLIKILFIILASGIVYVFTKKVTSSRKAGLLSMLLYAVSQTGSYTESFSRWKGDAFVPILLTFSVLALLYILDMPKEKNAIRIIIAAVALGSLILCAAVWNGGIYAYAAFSFAVIGIALSYFAKKQRIILPIMVLLLILAWRILPMTGIQKSINLQLDMQPASIIGAIPEILGQLEPLAYQTSLLYHNSLLYALWVIIGFLGSFALVFITILKFAFKDHTNNEKRAYLAALSLLLFGIPFAIISTTWNSLIYLPVSILAGSSIALLSESGRKKLLKIIVFAIPLIVIFTLYQIITTPIYEGISSQFHRQLLWVSEYTPANATFLAFGGDGTAIQYWANRTTFEDSNIADNLSEMAAYYNFLYARAGNFSYLREVRPDYLLLHDIPYYNGSIFNGSNIQYLIEFALSNHTSFYYDKVNFLALYVNFSMTNQENRTIIYRLSYSNTS